MSRLHDDHCDPKTCEGYEPVRTPNEEMLDNGSDIFMGLLATMILIGFIAWIAMIFL